MKEQVLNSIKTLSVPLQQRLTKTWEYYSGLRNGNGKQQELKSIKKSLQERLETNYFQPSAADLEKAQNETAQWLSSGRITLQVPMREKDRTINSLLDYATGRMRENSIYVINDESEKEAVKTVKNYPGVKLIDAGEVLNALDWKRLLPILNLDKRPKGKGTTVLAGYLFQYGLSQVSQEHSQWIFHSDADVENCAVFQPLEYLTWGAVAGSKEAIHIKIAKAGRNNESSMTIRNALLILESLTRIVEGWESGKVAERAKALFEHLAPYKWMLGGAFGLNWEAAMHRPFATGYLDETLVCAFCEDFARSHNYQTVQVVNPNPCLDAENDFQKENIIVQLASNFVLILALAQKPVNEWGISEIKRINRDLMSNPVKMVFIPKQGDEGPVKAEVVANERILPSVRTLDEAGLIDKRRLYSLVEKIKG